MSHVLSHAAHGSLKINHRQDRARPLASRVRSAEEVKAMLRDIAFVLKMTERVRNEMESQHAAGDLVHA
ncbi:MAG: hypothetical protein HYX68_08905 [Planctomycetes bacterium]|nr:hypothetical protein [Planctomycetota bacterium]